MAEAFFNHMAEQRGLPARACSCGVHPFGESATSETMQAAGEYGVDLSQHQPQPMTDALAKDADLILTMTQWHTELVQAEFPAADGKTFTLLEFLGGEGDVPDPFNRPRAVYRRCAEQLWEAVGEVVHRLQTTAVPQVT